MVPVSSCCCCIQWAQYSIFISIAVDEVKWQPISIKCNYANLYYQRIIELIKTEWKATGLFAIGMELSLHSIAQCPMKNRIIIITAHEFVRFEGKNWKQLMINNSIQLIPKIDVYRYVVRTMPLLWIHVIFINLHETWKHTNIEYGYIRILISD